MRVDDIPPPFAPSGGSGHLSLALDRPLRHLVNDVIRAVIDAEGGSVTRASRRLGISVRTLQRRR